MKITIMRDQLIAALCIAAKGDIRGYLNGVYVEATQVETRLTSSTGGTLLMQRADAKGENDVIGTVRLIVPREALEKIRDSKALRTFEINDDGGKWGVFDYPTRTTFEPIDAKYPDFQRVIPQNTSGEAAQFNPELIAQFAKASKAFKKLPCLDIPHNGGDAALVSIGRDLEFIGLLMPWRRGKDQPPVISTPPAWTRTEIAADEDLV